MIRQSWYDKGLPNYPYFIVKNEGVGTSSIHFIVNTDASGYYLLTITGIVIGSIILFLLFFVAVLLCIPLSVMVIISIQEIYRQRKGIIKQIAKN